MLWALAVALALTASPIALACSGQTSPLPPSLTTQINCYSGSSWSPCSSCSSTSCTIPGGTKMEDVATLTIADAGCDEWNDGNQCYGTITFYIYKGTGYTGEQGSEACTLDSGQTPVYSGTAQKVDGTTTTFTSTSQTLPAGLLLVRRVLGDESQ